MNSLQPFCSLRLVSWPFHSGEEALPSWGLGTLSAAAPVAQVQHWCHGRTSGLSTEQDIRQVLLCKLSQGLPQNQDRAAQSCLTCSTPSRGEIPAEGM